MEKLKTVIKCQKELHDTFDSSFGIFTIKGFMSFIYSLPEKQLEEWMADNKLSAIIIPMGDEEYRVEIEKLGTGKEKQTITSGTDNPKFDVLE